MHAAVLKLPLYYLGVMLQGNSRSISLSKVEPPVPAKFKELQHATPQEKASKKAESYNPTSASLQLVL